MADLRRRTDGRQSIKNNFTDAAGAEEVGAEAEREADAEAEAEVSEEAG
jgi:hypothetical protein